MNLATPTDAEAFHAFLTLQLGGAAREKSPEELLRIWRDDHAAAIEDIRYAIGEMEAGRMRPLREVDKELRAKYNIPRDA